MKHYGMDQWVDFVRGLLPETETTMMREHLLEGCSECKLVADFCEQLTSVCRSMVMDEVPESAVRLAKTIFPVRRLEPRKRAFRLPIELIYDSFMTPAPAGLRASWQVGWQALYRAGDCSLDLRIEPELHSLRATVIGQISNHVQPESGMTNVPVYLKAGKSVVAETISNRFGEFQLDYEQRGRLELCVSLEGGAKSIMVPLKKIGADKPVGAERLHLGSMHGKKRSGFGKQ